MYRITLKNVLPAALLLAGANAFAADNEVTLNGVKTTWSSVVAALNTTTDLEALNAEKTAADAAVNNFAGEKTEYVPVAWLADVIQQAKTFAAAYDEAVNDGDSEVTEPTFYYKVATSAVTQAKTFYFAFSKYSNYTETTPSAFIKAVLSEQGNSFASLRIYLGSDYANNNGFIIENNYDLALEKFGDHILDQVKGIAEDPAYGTEQNTAAYQALLDKQKAAEAAVKAATEETPKTIVLQGNVTADETITNAFTGTINGNSYSITAPMDGVFASFNGTISNVIVNGTFAETEGDDAKFTNVAVWNGRTGKFYNNAGDPTECKSLGELAYASRTRFGVENNALVKVTKDNIAYSIKLYAGDVLPTTPTYVTYDGNKFITINNGRTVNVASNQFIQSETDDLAAANVIYNGTAQKVVITDGVEFSCPVEVEAAEVEYTRNFQKGYNTLFLPFDYTTSDFDGATVTLATYTNVTGDKFNFTSTKAVEANTPVLMEADGACTLTAYNVTIKKTDEVTIGETDGCYGTFTATATSDVEAGKVFGLTGDGTFKYTGSKSQPLAAFRMFIVYNGDTTPAQTSISRGINIIDPDDDMTGIESVENDANGFAVAGGAGVITINSAADCGNVAVYAVDGRVAANAYVTAGTTTVEVPAGLYIVNGQKVIVK